MNGSKKKTYKKERTQQPYNYSRRARFFMSVDDLICYAVEPQFQGKRYSVSSMPVSRHLCPVNQGFFRPYCVTAARRFLMRSAACLRVIRFRQSGQYLTLFDFGIKNVPHLVQRFLSSVLKSSA